MSRNQSPALLATGNISPSTFVKLSTSEDNSGSQAGANAVVIGISGVGVEDPPGVTGSTAYHATDDHAIELLGLGDIGLLKAGTGGWTRGDFLESDASGNGVTAAAAGTARNIGAIALENCAASELGRVQVLIMQIDPSADSTSNVTVSNGDGTTDLVPVSQHLGLTKANSSVLLGSFNTTDDKTVAPMLGFLKSGNATLGSNTIVASGEVLGELIWFGADGTDFESPAGAVRCEVDATPGVGDMPGRLVFLTTADGGETLTEAMRINNSQQVIAKNRLTSDHATAGVGYSTGAGGAVTQITTIATGVTLNKVTGQITTVAATTAAAAEDTFTVTNSAVAATDVVLMGTTYAGAGTPLVFCKKVAAGSFDVTISNLHASAALDALLVINFAVIKGVAA